MLQPHASRLFDLVLFGATGFVGKLTAAYLAQHAPPGARIALAARSVEKLKHVRAALPVAAANWELLKADSGDQSSLRKLAASTRVVATTVGPYALYGLPLVEACADAGTHYADLTGEVLFMRRSIELVAQRAQTSGARIVHACGFDSIPSDLGVMSLHKYAQATGAGELLDTTYVGLLAGAASGGTIDSMRQQLAQTNADPALAKILLDPYSLSPNRAAEPDLGLQSDVHWVRRDPNSRLFLAPFVMAGVNTRVVRRSNALQNYAYGRRVRYREAMGTGEGATGAVRAGAVIAGLGALVGGLSFGPTRWLLDRLLPKPGEGPSVSVQNAGYFKIDITADTSSGRQIQCRIRAAGDPGYKATAVMLGEASLCLAFDQQRLPAVAGVLTPATAMGEVLVDRLRAAGQSYDLSDVAHRA